jgi:hypothetical protein
METATLSLIQATSTSGKESGSKFDLDKNQKTTVNKPKSSRQVCAL